MLERGPGRRRFAVTWMDHRPAPSVSNCAARRSRRGPPHVTREPFCPAPVLEHLRITHRCHHSGRTDRTDARYAAKTPASLTVRRSKFNGLFTRIGTDPGIVASGGQDFAPIWKSDWARLVPSNQ